MARWQFALNFVNLENRLMLRYILWCSAVLYICRAHRDGGDSQGGTRHSLPLARRRGGFNFDNQLNSSTERWWRRTGYYGLSRLSKIRQTIPLPLKQTQALEKACFLVNYSPKQEPNKSSSLRTRCHEVLRATTCPQVPRVDRCTHFYMECDIMLAVYVRTLQAQWQESLWLAEALLAKLGHVQFCGRSSINELRQMRPVRALRFLIPSKLEGSEAQLTEKQAVLWCTTYILY